MKDRDIMFKLCKAIFLIGGGNYWYEEDAIGNQNKIHYMILSFALYSCYLGMTILELLAAAIGDVTVDERCHAISHGVSHTLYMFKILNILMNRESIKSLLHDLVHACESLEEESTSKKKYRLIKLVIGAYCSAIFGAVITYVVQGIMYVFEGQNFFVIITYYATPSDSSLPATFFRIGTTLTIIAMLVTMTVSVDGLVISIMIILKYKFIVLKKYFKQLNDDMIKRVSQTKCDVNIASNKLYDGLKEGVIMHLNLLKLSKELDKNFAFIMTNQLFGSSFPVVFLLLQMDVSGKTDIVYALKILAFIVTVFFLLGIYLCTFGNITYEASTLADAIFYSGWHLCPSTSPAHRKIRALIIMACAQSQLPITMKAFNMVDLTHATYVEVIKSTYSVYALLQARNQN